MNYFQAPLLDEIRHKQLFIQEIIDAANPFAAQTATSFSANRGVFPYDLSSMVNAFASTDYVWLLYSNNLIERFSLPTQLGLNKCKSSGGPGLNYLSSSTSTECTLSLDDVNNECSTTQASALSLSFFLTNKKIISVIKLIKRIE
jgi:ABC-type transporter Mla subunit MlaD